MSAGAFVLRCEVKSPLNCPVFGHTCFAGVPPAFGGYRAITLRPKFAPSPSEQLSSGGLVVHLAGMSSAHTPPFRAALAEPRSNAPAWRTRLGQTRF